MLTNITAADLCVSDDTYSIVLCENYDNTKQTTSILGYCFLVGFILIGISAYTIAYKRLPKPIEASVYVNPITPDNQTEHKIDIGRL